MEYPIAIHFVVYLSGFKPQELSECLNHWLETGCEKGVLHTQERFYITSLTGVNDFAYAVRKRRSIENQLHWCLDVVFREDSAKARKDNSPLNMNVLRIGIRKKMLKVALDISSLEKVVFQGK